MAGIPKEHDTLYFDKLCRTQKGETVLSLIQATYHAKRNLQPGENVRDEIAKRLVHSYSLFRDNPTGADNGAGTYSGTQKQFESQYTIGHELCIWKNSNLDLTDLAIRVAENEITIKQYFDVFFFNYFQPVNGKGIHVLYYILDYMLKHNSTSISKEDIPTALGVASPREMTNALCNFLNGTTYIAYDGDELKYIGKEDLSVFIENCNTRYIGENGLTLARSELDTVEKYATYITSSLVSVDLQIGDTDAMKILFVNWLEKQGRAQTYIKGHLTHLNMLSKIIGKNIYSIDTVEEVMDLYDKIKNDSELKQKDDATHNHYSAATKAYANFLSDYLNNGGIKANKYSAEWFKSKAPEFDEVGNEANLMRQNFVEKYGVDELKARQGEELLNFLFLGGNEDNLCHELEYAKRNRELFGSVKSGTAFKYPLFKRDGVWVTGSSRKPKSLTLSEAIILGTSVRDQIVKAVEEIKNNLPINSVEDYLNLYTKLYAIMPDLVDSLWIIKYFHMLFPELMPVFYNKEWQVKVLAVIDIAPSETLYGRLGQIALFVVECGISNVVFAQIFHKYCRSVEIEEEDETDLDNCDRVTGGTNIILYGVPGAGKSWTIKDEYCDDESRMERLVFHPDYTYSDFVGQIMPVVNDDGSVSYAFNPGPFTKLMKKAYNNPDEMFYLVIEEVNRGNAPAIFGDVFQLLDRNKDGASEYAITNADIAKVVYDKENHKVSIPSNLSILCTMNTSDQNVFTLDTAFQRRWNMRLIQNKFRVGEEKEQEFAKTEILDTTVTWEKFFTEINKIILDKNIRMTSSEDKRLGTHFVSVEDLKYEEGDNKQNSKFPEKVLKYLWDDAFKFTKEDVFDLEKVKSLEDVIELFLAARGSERFRIFKENIFNTIVVKANPETENTDNN